MNSEKLERKLLAAARAAAPSDRVPYAFEKRVMARLLARPSLDSVALWARALWRAAVPCVAISFLLGFWAVLPPGQGSNSEPSISQDLDNAVYAAVEQQLGEAEEW
jgi:hypothetical protein